MIQNEYAALLDADVISVKHPVTKKNVKLYRIIALKTFKLDRYDSVTLSKLETLTEQLNLIQNEISELQTHQDNLSIVINDSILQENFRRGKELQNELDTVSAKLELLQTQADDLRVKITNCNNILETKTIEQHRIGGYVQSIDNLDPDNPVWVDHRSRVFDNAKILNGSLITESSVIYGNAKIDASRIKNYARVHGNAEIIKSTIKDLSEIKGDVRVSNCLVGNAAMIFENAVVDNTILETGSCIRGHATVHDSILKDTSQIQGYSEVTNCKLGGRAVLLDGVHSDNEYYEDENLKTESYSE